MLPTRPTTQVQRNVGHGAITIDEYYYSSCQHNGLCSMACSLALQPAEGVGGDEAKYYAGRPAVAAGDPCQHEMPMAKPVYVHAAAFQKDPNFDPWARAKRAAPNSKRKAVQGLGAAADPATPADAEDAAAGPSTGNGSAAATPQNRRQRSAKAQTISTDPTDNETQIRAGFAAYRSFKEAIILQRQQRQDSSASGQLLQQYASLFNGSHGFDLRTEVGQAQLKAAITAMLDDLNSRAIGSLQELADLVKTTIRVVTWYNEVRHFINTTCLLLDAKRLEARVTVWNARHQRAGCGRNGNRVSLTAMENVAAMRAADKHLDHFTADTYVFNGCLMTLLSTNPDAGAARNMVVRVRGLITDPNEPDDDGSGPYRRLLYMPLGVIVEHVTGASTAEFLKGEQEFEGLPDGALVIRPELSRSATTVTVPDTEGKERKLSIRRYNVPLGDAYCVTDYFVQVGTAELDSEKWRPD